MNVNELIYQYLIIWVGISNMLLSDTIYFKYYAYKIWSNFYKN